MQPFFTHFHHAHDLLSHVVTHLAYVLGWLV